LFMQGQLGFSPLRAGLAVVPLALAFAVASRLAGRWVVRYGVRTLVLGCRIQLCGLVGLADVIGWLPDPDFIVVVAVLTVFGFGQGLVVAPLSGLVLATVRPAHAGSAAGMLNTVQQAAGAAGVSVVGLLGFHGNILAALAVLGCALLATARLLPGLRPQPG
jgi:MFS family permease